MITCFIRYTVDLNRIKEFKRYARTWITLVEKYGGMHHGYFLPETNPSFLSEGFSFPNIGKNGSNNVAVALFSFSNPKKYQAYKKAVAKDKDCKYITAYFNKNKCFLSYERSFLKSIVPRRKK